MNHPDADRGRDDFLAGRKDEARYADAANGADYRRGWQLARLAAPGHCNACAPGQKCWSHGHGCEARPPAPVRETAPESPRNPSPEPADDCPFAPIPPQPVQDAPGDNVRPPDRLIQPFPTAQDVKLATGDAPVKSKRAPKPQKDQLNLFS